MFMFFSDHAIHQSDVLKNLQAYDAFIHYVQSYMCMYTYIHKDTHPQMCIYVYMSIYTCVDIYTYSHHNKIYY